MGRPCPSSSSISTGCAGPSPSQTQPGRVERKPSRARTQGAKRARSTRATEDAARRSFAADHVRLGFATARACSILSGDDQPRARRMTENAAVEDTAQDLALADGDRLSLGVAARLSRYLQVLIQARKMGKETISSQELSEYTHINSTQIRRDLSGFGKFGKRGVGYRVDSLVEQIRKILRSVGQHNIVLFGAGNLGQAIASSDIFADHGFQIVAIFDVEPRLVGKRYGNLDVHDVDHLASVVENQEVVVWGLEGP